MDYKLNAKDGNVEVIKKAGSAYVKFTMPEGKCKGLIAAAENAEQSDKFDGFGIGINDGELFFAGEFTADITEKAADEPEKAEKKPVNYKKD